MKSFTTSPECSLISNLDSPRKRLWLCRLARIAFCVIAMAVAPAVASATTPQMVLKLEADGALQTWQEKKKFFLVIVVDQTGVKGTELPFAVVDGEKIATALEALGYLPLINEEPVLSNPTQGRVVEVLHNIRELPQTATVILYYSGHGVVDPQEKDVWLQLGGQSTVEDGLGISVSKAVGDARGASYKGELHIIVDACFSGRGALTGGLTLKEFGHKTTILTSSSESQKSFPVRLDDGAELSAFTYTLLEGWGREWSKADENHDGILSFEEVARYSDMRLQELYQDKSIMAKMQPQLIGSHDDQSFLAYKADKVRDRCSMARTVLTVRRIEMMQAASQSQAVSAQHRLGKPEMPPEAKALAKSLCENHSNEYIRALKAQAEGKLDEARELLTEAESKIEAEETEAEVREAEARERRQDRKARIYLARARMETYAGRYESALPWYGKLSSGSITDPRLLNEVGLAHIRAGRFKEAHTFLKEALDLRIKLLPKNDADLGVSFDSLATLYRLQGRYAEAEPLFQKAIGIREVALGPMHSGVAESIAGLAILYREQGNLAEAERLYQRALHINEAAVGPTHPDVAASVNNLAVLYSYQGRYAEAEPLYQRALDIDEAVFGPTHPEVAADLHSLANLYLEQGRFAEAEPIFQRALGIRIVVLGPMHADVARSMAALALLYVNQDKYAEAERLYQRALDINEAAFGPTHLRVARVLAGLGVLYLKQSKYAEAEPLIHRALSIREVALGPMHTDVAWSIDNLAEVYLGQGKYAEAEPLFHRAYDILRTQLGLSHPYTKIVLGGYVRFLDEHGDKQKLRDLDADLKIAIPELFTQ
jgi:tetratricopeptide (TPR) repeat protein